MSFPFLIQGNNLVVVIDNKPHTINKTHISYQKVVDAIKAGEWETVREVIDPKKVFKITIYILNKNIGYNYFYICLYIRSKFII